MSKRPKMLASVIREIIAPILRECPPACGIVSITQIEVSDDFTYATVYVSALNEGKQAVEFLKHRANDLQRRMSAINRKRIPLLRFRLDQTIEKSTRLDELLDGLK